jgi:hypothetical protein
LIFDMFTESTTKVGERWKGSGFSYINYMHWVRDEGELKQ